MKSPVSFSWAANSPNRPSHRSYPLRRLGITLLPNRAGDRSGCPPVRNRITAGSLSSSISRSASSSVNWRSTSRSLTR